MVVASTMGMTVIAIGEGTIDVERGRLAMRYYECEVELPLPELDAGPQES